MSVSQRINQDKTTPPAADRRWEIACAMIGGALLAYLILATSSLYSPAPSLSQVALVFGVTVVVGSLLLGHVTSATPPRRATLKQATLKQATLAAGTTLATLLLLDLCYGVYANRIIAPIQVRDVTRESLMTSPEAVHALPLYEVDGVVFYKPQVSVEATVVGNLYHDALRDIPAARNTFLEPRRVRYSTDEAGCRTATAFSQAEFIALGDSFTFGDGVDDADCWPSQFGSSTGRSVSNVGVAGSGPTDSVNRLQWLLTEHANHAARYIIWMIYEGNDLDDIPFTLQTSRAAGTVSGTIVEGALVAAESVRQNSIISRALTNRLQFHVAGRAADGYRFEEHPIDVPAFHSEAFGWKLFHPGELTAATMTAAQVTAHPGAARIRAAFERLRNLAELHELRVLVVVAPSAITLYRDQFDGLPPSTERAFAAWILQRSADSGFAFLDLGAELGDLARRELVYYRDDTHWNPRGHQAAAREIAKCIDVLNQTDWATRSRADVADMP